MTSAEATKTQYRSPREPEASRGWLLLCVLCVTKVTQLAYPLA